MFESAARHLSFTKSATELGVTQAAVSQQVRALEVELGVALFERHHRGLVLTHQGHQLLRSIVQAFDQIVRTVDQVREADQPIKVNVGVTFAIGTFWLVPRLLSFRSQFPEVVIDITATDEGFDHISDQVEVGLAYGDGMWPGYEATLLRPSVIFPVCSPEYRRRHPDIDSTKALLGEKLLSNEDARHGRFGWSQWFSELGLDASRMKPVIRFNSHPLVLQAACDSQGIALGWSLLTDDLIRDGRLVRPIDASVQTARGFYLVKRIGRDTPAISLFSGWVLAQLSGNPGSCT